MTKRELIEALEALDLPDDIEVLARGFDHWGTPVILAEKEQPPVIQIEGDWQEG